MENTGVDISTDDRIVTLVLGDNRIEADKEKLAKYSLYFASLFSGNFKDHTQNEFRINYDITLRTFKHFVNWVNNEGEHTRVVHSPKYYFFVRASLEIFLTGHYTELLELLELSVVFMAEKLTEHIVEMIVCMRFPPNRMLQIWLLAENLGLKVLRDIALASCLDRFDDIPMSSFAKLPVESLFKLILNVNVRSDTKRIRSVMEEWKKCNDIPKELPDSFVQFLNGDSDYVKKILDGRKQCYIQCVVGLKLNRSLGIWSWNGKSLKEFTEMTDSQMHTTFEDNGKEITGRQVTGGAFDIYLIGGEQGIGTGCFNMALWRYCPFSKKWYILTLLPRPRRHMAVAFIDNKLYLFGGIGRHRVKLFSVDIFNVHTGVWSKGSEIAEVFANVPPCCVSNNKFIYYKSFYSIYDPIANTWEYCYSGAQDDPLINDPVDFSTGLDDYEDPILSLINTREACSADTCIVYRAILRRNIKRRCIHESLLKFSNGPCSFNTSHTWILEDSTRVFDQQIINWPYLISFAHNEGHAIVEVGELRRSDRDATSSSLPSSDDTYRRLKIYSRELKNVAADCFKNRLGCFNLIDPASLHNLIPLPEQESISV